MRLLNTLFRGILAVCVLFYLLQFNIIHNSFHGARLVQPTPLQFNKSDLFFTQTPKRHRKCMTPIASNSELLLFLTSYKYHIDMYNAIRTNLLLTLNRQNLTHIIVELNMEDQDDTKLTAIISYVKDKHTQSSKILIAMNPHVLFFSSTDNIMTRLLKYKRSVYVQNWNKFLHSRFLHNLQMVGDSHEVVLFLETVLQEMRRKNTHYLTADIYLKAYNEVSLVYNVDIVIDTSECFFGVIADQPSPNTSTSTSVYPKWVLSPIDHSDIRQSDLPIITNANNQTSSSCDALPTMLSFHMQHERSFSPPSPPASNASLSSPPQQQQHDLHLHHMYHTIGEWSSKYSFESNPLVFVNVQNLNSASRFRFSPTTPPPRIVVSLTTLPPRLSRLHLTLRSVLDQHVMPDAIYVNIPMEYHRQDLPRSAVQVGKQESISVEEWHQYLAASGVPSDLLASPLVVFNRVHRDFGPITKLIPVLQREQRPNTVIITVDDDMAFKPTLVRNLYYAHMRFPGYAYGYAGQMVDRDMDGDEARLRGARGQVAVRTAWKWKDGDYPVDILEAFTGALYLRRFFEEQDLVAFFDKASGNVRGDNDHLSSIQIPPANASLSTGDCFYTDDIVISAYLASRAIARIKLKQGWGDVAEFTENDLISPLREENVNGAGSGRRERNNECASKLLPHFDTELLLFAPKSPRSGPWASAASVRPSASEAHSAMCVFDFLSLYQP